MSRYAIAAGLIAGLATPSLAADRSFNLAGFDKVAVAGGDNVSIRQGSAFRVVATGADDDLAKLDLVVENGQLKVRRKPERWSWGGKSVQVAVTMPALHALSVSGSANVTADRGQGPEFAMAISGSGNINVAALDAATVKLAVSGSGDATAAGKCGALDVRISGSGDAMLAGLQCARANIAVSGSGDVAAHATTEATVRVAGSGDVTITGGGRCTKKVAGSGTVRCG